MAEQPITRVDSVIRWEGNNISDFVKFMGDIPVKFEISGTGLHIKVLAGEGIQLRDAAVILEIFLRDGDGLLRDGHMLGVARDIVYKDERAGPEDKIH